MILQEDIEKMTVTEEIRALKKEKNAVILAHYYVEPGVQQIADLRRFIYGGEREGVKLGQDGAYAG